MVDIPQHTYVAKGRNQLSVPIDLTQLSSTTRWYLQIHNLNIRFPNQEDLTVTLGVNVINHPVEVEPGVFKVQPKPLLVHRTASTNLQTVQPIFAINNLQTPFVFNIDTLTSNREELMKTAEVILHFSLYRNL